MTSDLTPVYLTPVASATDYIAGAQAIGGAGNMTLDGTTTFDSARLVTITDAGNDSGVTFTVTGTLNGETQTESLAGGNASTVTTTKYFDSVTQIAADSAAAGNVEAGIAGDLFLYLRGSEPVRVRAIYVVCEGTAATLVFNDNGSTGTALLTMQTPATDAEVIYKELPAHGVRFPNGCAVGFDGDNIQTLTVYTA